MKTVLRHHPLKMIQLRFQENIRPPEFEVAALRKYYAAHDKIWELKMQYETQDGYLMLFHNAIFDHYMSREQLREPLEVIKDALHKAGTPLGKTYFQEQLGIDLMLFFEQVMEHNKKMQEMHGKVAKLARQYNDATMHPLVLPDFDLFPEVFQRYEEVEVDTVSLDKDYQEFLNVYKEVDELFQDYLARGEEVFDAYAYLYDENEAFYREVEVVREQVEHLLEP